MKLRNLYPLLFVFLFIYCSKKYIKQKENFSHYALKDNRENNNAKDFLKRYKIKVDSATKKIIAVSDDFLTREKDQSSLGNFVCDALKYAGELTFPTTQIDIVLVNRGGMRTNLPKGEIKVLNIFEVMPFENELVLLTITGKQLNEGITIIMEKKHSYLGMQIKMKNEKIIATNINGKEIDNAKSYTILTSDYLANGGDGFTFLDAPISIKNSNLKIRDAIINYCFALSKNSKHIIPYTDGRLEISN